MKIPSSHQLAKPHNPNSTRGAIPAPTLKNDQHDTALATRANLLLGLEVVGEDGALLGVLTPVLDDNARAVDDLASVTLTVKSAYRGREKILAKNFETRQ